MATHIDTEIDIYSDKIDNLMREAMVKLDQTRRKIGIVPPLGSCECNLKDEQESYSSINFELVGRNIALENMLRIAKEELVSARHVNDRLRAALSRYENRVKGLEV